MQNKLCSSTRKESSKLFDRNFTLISQNMLFLHIDSPFTCIHSSCHILSNLVHTYVCISGFCPTKKLAKKVHPLRVWEADLSIPFLLIPFSYCGKNYRFPCSLTLSLLVSFYETWGIQWQDSYHPQQGLKLILYIFDEIVWVCGSNAQHGLRLVLVLFQFLLFWFDWRPTKG